MDLIFKNLIIVADVLTFFALLRAGANRPAPRDPATGDLVLQCGKGLVWTMGTIAVLGPISMGLLSFIIPFKFPAQVFVPIVIGLFFLLLGGFFCYWALRRRTRVGPRGLASEYMFAQPRSMAWADVVKLDLSNGQELFVCDKNGQKAMLHVWFHGVKEAVPLLRTHLPAAVRKEYAETIEAFAMRVGTE